MTHPGGAPTKYDPEKTPEQARKLYLLGLTDEELADVLGVVVKTLHNWRAAHPEFLHATIEGKQIADAEVAERLYQRAMGYSHPEEKVFNNGGEILRAETTKHYPPDTQAASLWLRNRQPEKWRDKTDQYVNADLKHSGSVEWVVDANTPTDTA